MRLDELIKKLEEIPNRNLIVKAHEGYLVLGRNTLLEITKEEDNDKRGRKELQAEREYV